MKRSRGPETRAQLSRFRVQSIAWGLGSRVLVVVVKQGATMVMMTTMMMMLMMLTTTRRSTMLKQRQ